MSAKEKLAQCYGSLHMAVELVEKMADARYSKADALELQRLTREAACEANALTGTIGGQPHD